MSEKSSIEWTDSTWNPVTGCTKISPGCLNCYAERLALRLQAMGNPNYKNGFNLTMHEKSLALPLKWKKPRKVLVNSMSDLFHDEVSDEYIYRVFQIMCQADWHQYQILTKRPERLLNLSPHLPWRPNIWMGVTVEDQLRVDRIEYLLQTKAFIKFISFEPLISPITDATIKGIDWVIVGGESGPNARRMNVSWVLDIREKCKANDIPFFFKQWGGNNRKKAGRILEGRTYSEMPKALLSQPQHFSQNCTNSVTDNPTLTASSVAPISHQSI